MSTADTPQIPIQVRGLMPWLLRLAAHEDSSQALGHDPVAFAAWYAVLGRALPWPEEVQKIREEEREKTLSLEEITKLLQQVNYAFASRTNAAHARHLLEGYAVHNWVKKHVPEFQQMAQAFLTALDSAPLASDEFEFEARLTDLGGLLGLNELEQELLSFAFVITASPELQAVFSQLVKDRWAAERIWTITFDVERENLVNALRAESPLRLSGLLRASEGGSSFASVSPFWLDLLVNEDSLEEALLESLQSKVGAGTPAQMDAADMSMAVAILKGSDEPGVNMLLYGAPSMDKRYLLSELVQRSGRVACRMRAFEDASRSDRPALAYVAQRVLAQCDYPAVLVIDRPTDVLEATPSSFMRMFFGIEPNMDAMRPFDEMLLDTNEVPVIWLASAVDMLPADTVAHFVFHAPLKRADRETRRRQMTAALQGMELSETVRESILKLESVSASQLQAAVKAARLSRNIKAEDRDQAILQAVRRSQRALGRDLQAKRKQSDTVYSLEYLNTAGRFGPEQVLAAFQRSPKGSMVLYGPPGTGKTQFVEHLASELGKPLVSKKASELLSKYIGDSEKAIAAAFEEAMAEEAILFFDEGDSFLRDRSKARESWEVTRVNEMLQHIERFEGIVVISTNLVADIDVAALRRFSFKIEFRALNPTQRWSMFLNESGIQADSISPEQKQEWHDKLAFMTQLTPGDFAVVQQQCRILGLSLTAEQWLEQLQLECDIKRRG